MTDRTISVRLKANIDEFKREMGTAATAAAQVAKAAKESNNAAQTTAGQLARSAKQNGEAWRTVGASLTGVGVAATALNLAVAKTGIDYNTLQQKSRAALTTILGGAQQANEQMDKLDEFARTSPFSKAVFIDAQQQMLGFGIEAKKVIPYLNAINETVAATGGNNNDIAELTRIFSQVQAAAKITATDLMQFGQRGVDAATLIGSQMGMTGAQIRLQITDGSLDAGKALDALAAGMESRFAGASAGVKNTMEGAFDRVKAAWRDLSASIMDDAVGPEGGGWLVGLTNGAADFLRAVEKLPDPVKDAGAAMSVLAAGSALAAGGALTLGPRILDLHFGIKQLATDSPKAAAAIKAMGTAAGPTAVALAGATMLLSTVASDMANYKAEVEAYADALKLPGLEADRASRKLAAQALAAKGVADELEYLGVKQALATDAAMGDADARGRIIEAYDREIQKRRDLADVAAAEGDMWSEHGQIADNLISKRDSVITAIDKEIEKRGLSAEALEAESALMGESAEKADTLTTSLSNLSGASEAFAERLGEFAAADAGFLTLLGAYDQVIEKNKSAAQAVADSTDDAADSWQDYIDDHKFQLGAYLQQLRDMVKAQEDWESNMVTLAGRVSQETLDELARLGPEGAPLVAELVTATDEELAEFDDLFANAGAAATGAFAEELDKAPAVWSALLAVAGRAAVDGAKAEIAAGKATLQDIINRYNLKFLIDANTNPADRAVNLLIARINARTATLDIRTRVLNRNGLNAPVATGGYGADVAEAYHLASGGQARKAFHQGALVDGPGTPTSDSIAAWLSRREFVQRAAAVDYYGTDVMYALNAKRIPKEIFAPLGYADGGTPAHTYAPAGLHSPLSRPNATAATTADRVVIQSNIHYPVAEPASVREKQLLDHAAALGL